MICYFSATGNSRHVANRLAQSLNESVTPVLDVLGKDVAVDDQMILVYPNYCGGVPSVIREFLQKNIFRIKKNARLILVITYGSNTGASASIAAKYFKKNTGRTFDAMYSVKMPDNWTPVFDLTNADEVAEINRKADEEIDGIIRKIKMGGGGDHVNDKLGKFIIVFGNVGAHTDAEAAFKGMLAAHQHDPELVPDTLVVIVGGTVMQV